MDIITKESLAKYMKEESKISYKNYNGSKNYAYSEKDLERLAGEILSIIQIHTPVKINTQP